MRKDSAHHRFSSRTRTRTMGTMTTSRNILIIDDDPNIRESLRMVLEGQDFVVSEAHDGEEGILKAIGELPHLIIVDMMMPRVSGFTVIERLKHHHQLAIPIMMLTGNQNEQQRAYAEFLGVDQFLSKPIRASELLNHVSRLMPASLGQLPPIYIEAEAGTLSAFG